MQNNKKNKLKHSVGTIKKKKCLILPNEVCKILNRFGNINGNGNLTFNRPVTIRGQNN